MELDRRNEESRLAEITRRLQQLRSGKKDNDDVFDLVVASRNKYISEIKALEEERDSLAQGQLVLG